MNRFLKTWLALSCIAVFCGGCTKTFQPKNPIGSAFPNVGATILTGEEVTIPAFFNQKPVLLLIGYVQDSQFDVDRWLLALKQLKTNIRVAEIPAIQGFFPQMISNRINGGMRDGIPEEDWKIVFTVYKDSEKIAQFLGNDKPQNVRAVLLDESGMVRWFHDRGFSADRSIELDNLIKERYAK